MSGSDNRKQSLYFPEEMLAEIQHEAGRQDRSINVTPRCFSNRWTVRLAVACCKPFASAPREKLRSPTTSQ